MKRVYISPDIIMIESNYKGILMNSGDTDIIPINTDDPQDPTNALSREFDEYGF